MTTPIKPPPWNKFYQDKPYRYLLFFEWAAEWILYFFERFASIKLIVNGVVAISILVGIILFYLDLNDRKMERAARRATMLGTIAQVAALDKSSKEQSRVVPIVETLVKQKMDLSSLPLPGANLRKAELKEAKLNKANFRYSDLGWANLQGANLSEAIISEADLSSTNFFKAKLHKTSLVQSNLYLANFEKAELQDASLSEARLIGTNLQKTNLDSASFWNADLTDAKLIGANLKGTYFANANLNGANFQNATFGKAKPDEEYIESLRISGGDTSPVKPTSVNMSGAYILGADFSKTNLTCDVLKGALNKKGPHSKNPKYFTVKDKDYPPPRFPKHLKVKWNKDGTLKSCNKI